MKTSKFIILLIGIFVFVIGLELIVNLGLVNIGLFIMVIGFIMFFSGLISKKKKKGIKQEEENNTHPIQNKVSIPC